MNFKRDKIILVDDTQANLDQGANILRAFYEVYPAPSAARLFNLLEKVVPALIILDIEMTEMNGYETIKKLKSDDRFKDIPVIFVTAKIDFESEIEGFDLGAVDYIAKPFSAPILLKRIEKELLFAKQKNDLLYVQSQLKKHLDSLEVLVHDKTDAVLNLQNTVFTTVIEMVEFRDKYTGGHIERTRLYLKTLLEEMLNEGVYAEEVAQWDINAVLSASKLHDVGKIAVSDTILCKNEKLTSEEFELMKAHVIVGIEAIEKIISKMEEYDFLNHAMRITGTHHEKWDGSGYPIGIKGKSIPLEGRLMAIADVYDALITERPYKKALSHEETCKIIEAGAGKHFDPVLIDVFRNVEEQFEQIAKEFTSSKKVL